MSEVALAEIAPVEPSRRIKTLDVLRGLAILGILPVNAVFFAAPWQNAVNPLAPPLAITSSDAWAWFVPHVFFEVKFITLFSLLFGASLYLVGGERDDLERGKVLHRRLAWMLLFGVVHGAAIWFGDVLFVYAISGVLVMFARSWSARTLMLVGAALYAFMVARAFFYGSLFPLASPESFAEVREDVWAPTSQAVNAAIAAFGGTFAESFHANFDAWWYFVGGEITNTVPRTVAIMMIGLALFKSGFLSARAPVWIYAAVAAIGAAALAVVAYQAQLNYATDFDFVFMQSGGALVNPALSILITLMYASLLILSVKLNVFSFLTNALAPVGQMAFTNYVAQSVIMTMIFYGGRGLGFYGEVSRDTLLSIVAGVWALQLVWSPIWLSHFSMGPLEWLWRRLSYGKPLAIGKAAAA